MFRSKNYKESSKLIDKQALYDPMEALNLEMSKTCQLVRENLMQGGYDVDFAAEFSLDPILNQPEE